jgi:hypothetical protein
MSEIVGGLVKVHGKELDGLMKAATELREAELELGKKVLPFTVRGGDLRDLSDKIGIKVPLLKELSAVALGVRVRHGRSINQMRAFIKKAV